MLKTDPTGRLLINQNIFKYYYCKLHLVFMVCFLKCIEHNKTKRHPSLFPPKFQKTQQTLIFLFFPGNYFNDELHSIILLKEL